MNLRTVRLWCCYDYKRKLIIMASATRQIAAMEVKRISGTILLKLTGNYLVPREPT